MGRYLLASVDYLPRLGGVSAMTHHLANALARLGHDTTVLAPREAEVREGWTAEYSVYRDDKARPDLREGPVWKTQEKPRLVERLVTLWQAEGFDRALAMHPYYFGPGLVEAGQRMSRPVSVVFHGYELRSQLLAKARWQSVRKRLGGSGPSISAETISLARAADEILVNSRYTASLVRRTRTSAPVRVIGCGLDRSTLLDRLAISADGRRRLKASVRDSLGLPQDALVVGTLGRLVSSKNPADLVRLLARNQAAYAMIVGSGPERERLYQLASQTGCLDRLRLVDAPDELKKWELLSAMDVFCLLSTPTPRGEVEGFGIVLLEASAAGIPVIAARAGGMLDIVRHNQTGLTIPGRDITALDKAVARLADDARLRRQLVAKAQAQLITRFNFEQIAEELIETWQAEEQTGRHLGG